MHETSEYYHFVILIYVIWNQTLYFILIYRIKNITVEFIDAIQFTQMITKSTEKQKYRLDITYIKSYV